MDQQSTPLPHDPELLPPAPGDVTSIDGARCPRCGGGIWYQSVYSASGRRYCAHCGRLEGADTDACGEEVQTAPHRANP